MTSRIKRQLPAQRSTLDSHAFMKEEKFDTWLDLSPLHELQKYCALSETWTTKTFSPINCMFSSETICLLLKSHISTHLVRNALVTPCLPSIIINFGLTHSITSSHLPPATFLKLYSDSNKAALMSFGYQLQHVLHNLSPELLNLCAGSVDVWQEKMNQLPIELMNMAYIVEDFMRVLEAYKVLSEFQSGKTVSQRTRARLQRFYSKYKCNIPKLDLPSIGGHLILSLDLCILEFDSSMFLLTHKYLLEIINKVNETFCGLLYCHFASGTCLAPEHYMNSVLFLQHLSGVITSFCRYSNKVEDLYYENRAFMYLKVIEGLGVACIMLREDKVKGWYNDTLVLQLWKSVIEERLQPRTDFFDSDLARLFDLCTISTISELLGMVKLCGHPSIEILSGLAKLKERTHAALTVNREAVNRTVGVMKRELILNFRRRRSHYPNVHLEKVQAIRPLLRLINYNINPDSDEGIKLRSNILIEHWSQIELGKNDEFDPIDNQLVLLKDKALGLVRSKVFQTLMTNTSPSSSFGLGPIEERRALLAFLLSDHFTESFKQYMEQYENDTEWSASVLEYLVIKLTAKELEEKPEGRMFGASPGEERNRRVVQEENSMRIMDNYFRDQLMTPDELQMLRKLFSFRHFNKMYPNHKLIQVSFDFSKWNNNMREESIDAPAQVTLDKWFGRKFHGKTMRAYKSTLFYYKDMLRSEFWEGQLGGIEGLNQATWSLLFLCGIKQALEGLGVTYQLTVKGDDVRAALVIPESEFQAQGVIRIRDNILSQLSILCNDMGWQLNPHECFVSLSVIATSKQYQVNDTFLPSGAKKMLKMESLSNLIFPTTEDMVASIFSTAHSACSQATTILPCFLSALYVASRLLLRELWADGVSSIEDIAVLTLWPQCLGGPGSLPLQTFFVRGENDMLSVSVSLMRSIIVDGNNGITSQIINILSQKMDPNTSKRLLLSDPYSIPLANPERPAAVLKRLMKKHLPQWVRNSDLLYLLTEDTTRLEEEFIAHLLSMRPFVAKVVTALYEVSPFYIIQEILSKFMESSTIFAFFAKGKTGNVSSSRAHRALSAILIAARRRKMYWVSTLKHIALVSDEWLLVPATMYYDSNVCTTEIVHRIRENMWGFKIHGITYPSLVDQNMYFTTKDIIQNHPNWNIGNCATAITIEYKRASFQTTDRSYHYAAADGLAPWLGAQTASKLELPTLSTRVTSPVIQKIMKLIHLKVNAYILGPVFNKTVDTLLGGLTGIGLEQLNVLIPEAGGGHISHRVSINSFSVNTMPNSRPNLAQLVRLASDAGGALRGDITNRTVNFAARHFFSIVIATWPLQSHLVFPPDYPQVLYTSFHNDIYALPEYRICPWCCNNVDDIEIKFDLPFNSNLLEYRYMTLVGCSEFEERVLCQNIREALAGKIRRTALHEVQNFNDPLLLGIATHAVIQKLNMQKMKVYEAAKGADFMCTPRNELLQIMSVVMGIRSLSSISKNVIRILPTEALYTSLLAELFSFCIDWLGVTENPNHIYLVDKISDNLNPLAGLFDELSSSHTLEKVRQGAIQHGGLSHFKWTPASMVSGGAAMKCFFYQHSKIIKDWIEGKEIILRPKIFTNMEDNETIKAYFHREYKRMVRATLNKFNIVLDGFRISKQWQKILRTLSESNALVDHLIHAGIDEQYSSLEVYREDVADVIYRYMIDDIIEDMKIISSGNQEMFWGYSLIILALEELFQEGDWLDIQDADINSAASINVCKLQGLEVIDDNFLDPTNLEETLLYGQWALLMSSTSLKYVLRMCKMKFFDNNERIIDIFITLHEQCMRWLNYVNERYIMIMTYDNAELLLKKSYETTRNILEDHIRQYELHQHVVQIGAVGYHNAHCNLDDDEYHRNLQGLQRPILTAQTAHIEIPIAENIDALTYNDEPPKEMFYCDYTETLRGTGIHNTSVAKYLEIVDATGVGQFITELGADASIVCLADGIGGVTARFLASYPEAQVLYNSRYYDLTTGRKAVDADENVPPLEVTSLPSHINALARTHWKGMYPGDLSLPEVQQLVITNIKRMGGCITLVTMDADISWQDDLESARKLWMGALTVIGETIADYTLVVFKCFCIKHKYVIEICHTILALFSHVHLYRATYTRQRSSEFFIIFSQPRSTLTLSRDIYSVCHHKAQFLQTINIMTIVNASLANIGNRYMTYRRTGKNYKQNILSDFKMFIRNSAYPLNLQSSLSTLKIPMIPSNTCVCGCLSSILGSVSELIIYERAALDDLLEQLTDRRYCEAEMQVAHHHVVAYGWKAIQMQLRCVVKLLVAREWFSSLKFRTSINLVNWTQMHVDSIYKQTYILLRQWKGHVAYFLVDGHLMVSCEKFTDNWSVMIHSVVKKCMQITGSVMLGLGYIARRRDISAEMCAYLSSGITIDPCCINIAETIYTEPQFWSIPEYSVSLRAPYDERVESYEEVPSVQYLLTSKKLLRGFRKFSHVNVRLPDPNLIDHIKQIPDQLDEELVAIQEEFTT
ncbi:RdRp [hymenopteran chu-related virus 123]|uniref:RNA-directed RNA polymerase n=1 Tax=hymenopteran chu-related virus 123 TaxID=2847797 RepID=A0A7U3NUR9_9VIRU|nr:RdRp [hymenopteran chu-related virus 123]QPB73966.1 RdRp [hymenopteran chu-related virus 123]DAZ89730.1 TPA_asm: RNA-dependent RNA polymerase [Dioxys cincta mononega-like virus]